MDYAYFDRAYRLRHNRNQVRVDRSAYCGLGVGAMAATMASGAVGGAVGVAAGGAAVGLASGTLLGALYNVTQSNKS